MVWMGTASAAAAQSPPTYRAEFLGAATGATAMNQSGRMVLTQSLAPANERAFVAGPGAPLAPLPLPPGRVSSRAYDINDAGVIAGTVSTASYADPNFGAVAALWIPNGSGGYAVQELGKLAGDIGSAATALNNVGDVVGFSFGGMFRRAVWFTAPGGILNLDPLGAFDPRAINDQRVMACTCTIPFTNHAGRFDLNTLTVQDLGVPPGSFWTTTGGAINASGQVAGLAILTTSTSCDREAARYTDGIGWEIFSGCGPINGCGSLNDLGDVTMWVNTAGYVRFEGIGTYRTEDLIAAPVGHWYLFMGTGQINNARQIAVGGTNSVTGQSGLLLLTPDTTGGTTMCSGDGSTGPCPCGNESGLGQGEGCRNSTGVGAVLAAAGSNAVSNDDLVLHVAQGPPNKTALFFQGGSTVSLPFWDGIRCAGNPLIRLQAITLNASGAGASTVSIVDRGGVTPGVSRVYQTWYRDPNGPCGTRCNVSSGLRIDWQ
ncbi:MAG: hypothetical protein ACKVXR_14300 [Planctomycetota bacterium]